MRELSEITGLSTAAVSYALRGQRVSARTEARVRAAAERIGFRADPIATALHRIDTARMKTWVESLTVALQLDLIDAADFAR